MHKQDNQSGHIIFESVLAGVVIVLVVVAFMTYQSHMKSQAAAATTSAALTASAKSAAANQIAADAAKAQVETFYKAYLAAPTGTSLSSWQQQGFITATAATAATGKSYDPVTCSQNPLAFSKYTFSNPVVNATTATMFVTGSYSGPPAQTVAVRLGLKKVGKAWQVNTVACPASVTKK